MAGMGEHAGWLAAFAALAGSVALGAASPGPQKTTLQTSAFPGHGEHTVLVRTVVPAGGEVAAHTHPGLEMCTIVSGRAHVHIAGRPDQTLDAGGSYAAEPGVAHAVRNAGPGELVLVSTYVVDPSKPIATPVK